MTTYILKVYGGSLDNSFVNYNINVKHLIENNINHVILYVNDEKPYQAFFGNKNRVDKINKLLKRI